MTRFLRLFPAFRALEAELAESAHARIAAEDEVRLMRDRVESAIAGRDKAHAELTNALKSIANFETIRHGSPNVPFPEVFVMMPQPEQVVSEQKPPVPRTMREREQFARAESRKAAEERRRGLYSALDAVTEN